MSAYQTLDIVENVKNSEINLSIPPGFSKIFQNIFSHKPKQKYLRLYVIYRKIDISYASLKSLISSGKSNGT